MHQLQNARFSCLDTTTFSWDCIKTLNVWCTEWRLASTISRLQHLHVAVAHSFIHTECIHNVSAKHHNCRIGFFSFSRLGEHTAQLYTSVTALSLARGQQKNVSEEQKNKTKKKTVTDMRRTIQRHLVATLCNNNTQKMNRELSGKYTFIFTTW